MSNMSEPSRSIQAHFPLNYFVSAAEHPRITTSELFTHFPANTFAMLHIAWAHGMIEIAIAMKPRHFTSEEDVALKPVMHQPGGSLLNLLYTGKSVSLLINQA